jgi:hypothetical protein
MKWFLLGRDPPRVRSTDGQSSNVHFTLVIAPLLLFPFALFAVAQEISATTVSRTRFIATVVNAIANSKENPPGMAWIPRISHPDAQARCLTQMTPENNSPNSTKTNPDL